MLAWIAAAFAQDVPVQGALTTADGPVEGVHAVRFALHGTLPDLSLGEVWSETQAVAFSAGAFSARLGAESGNPLPNDSLDDEDLYLSVSVDSGPQSPLTPIGWAMRAGYAARAGVADAVSGQLSPSNLPDHVAFTDANQTFAGSITAVSFTGSAAGLTGVPAAAVTGATLTLTGAPSASGHVVPLGYLNTALAAYLPKTGGTLTGALNGTTAGFTGSVTAGSFTGSGSGLTQLPATGLTGVVANANLPTDLARTATPTFTGRTSVDTLSVGTTGVVFSAQVHGRGSSTADDLYHLATITPSSYNNSGMVCDVCMASRWATSGCATWYVSVGRYEGDVDSPAGQGFTLQRSFTTTSTTAPLRVSWLPGATGARGMRVWIETSLTTSGYVNSKWMCRGVGDGVVPGDLHIEQAGTITELQPRP